MYNCMKGEMHVHLLNIVGVILRPFVLLFFYPIYYLNFGIGLNNHFC